MTRPTDATASLLPPASTDLERDLEQVTARLDNIPTPMGTIWNHQTCPVNMLGFLAWGMGVDEWDASWSEQTMRDAIRLAPMLSQRKGTIWSLQNALNQFGMGTKVKEWWAMNPVGVPGTFEIVTELHADTFALLGATLTLEVNEQIKRVIDANKPVARSYTMTISFASFGFPSQITMASIGTPMLAASTTGTLQ